jgi:proteasome lid subunit RPN8/RPN11
MTRARAASISRSARLAIVAHARREAPRECCGLLVGSGRRVVLALPMTNVDSRPRTGFRIDPAEHIAARRVLRRAVPSLEIVGVYHSHPSGPATPSARDVAESHYPEWLFAIVAGAGRALRVFQIAGGIVTPVRTRWAPSRRRRSSP